MAHNKVLRTQSNELLKDNNVGAYAKNAKL